MSDFLRELAAGIELVVFDVDGVFTDGRLYYSAEGETLKVFHVHDGQGVKRLLKAGVQVAVISGRESAAVARRMRDLGIVHVFQGDEDKLPVFERLLREFGLDAKRAACVGDDLPDLPLMQRVGLAVTVPNAHPAVLAKAQMVTRARGGEGAVREVCDLILDARGAR